PGLFFVLTSQGHFTRRLRIATRPCSTRLFLWPERDWNQANREKDGNLFHIYLQPFGLLQLYAGRTIGLGFCKQRLQQVLGTETHRDPSNAEWRPRDAAREIQNVAAVAPRSMPGRNSA